MGTTEDLEPLKQWATPRQREYIDAVLKHGSQSKAARELGVSREALRDSLRCAKKRAARHGWSPEHDYTRTVPEGFRLRGVSTLYDGAGNVAAQWVKSAKDHEHRLEQLADAVQSLAEPFRGLAKPAKPPKLANEDLLCIYPMGDPHFGMYSWADETGTDFDVEIAERNLFAAVDQLVALAPPAKQGLLLNLGDFFHTDSSSNQTARSGNPLDVDSRWSRVLSVGVRTMRRCIDRALQKHESVRVINEIGNHDDHSAVFLSLCLQQFYDREPRVQIDTSPQRFHWLRFGRSLIGVTHGDSAKYNDLPGIMAADRAKDWGETRYRYWYTGHVHHESVKEFHGCTVETFRTLAGRDAWHHGAGYRADRDMRCDVIHARRGKVQRFIVGIEQIEEAA